MKVDQKHLWGCMGSQVGTEVWQPGKVLSNRIESNQTYLVAVQTTGPHFNWTTLKQTTRPRRSTKSTTHSSIQHQKSIIGIGKWLEDVRNQWPSTLAQNNTSSAKKYTYLQKRSQTKQSTSPTTTPFKWQTEHYYHSDNSAEQEKHTSSRTCNSHWWA